MATTAQMPIANILVRNRRRPISEAKVAGLMVSMAENGFIGTIDLRLTHTEAEEGLYELVTGAHRLEAWKRLGNKSIPFTLKNLTDDEAAQIEIDENLIAPGMTPLERAEFLAARYPIWARRFPDRVTVEGGELQRKRGRPGNDVKLTQFLDGTPPTMGFAADTASEIGLSKATIDRAWRIASHIPNELRARLHNTPLAKNEGLLRQLAGLGDKVEQAKVADLLISGEAKTVPEGQARAAGNQPMKAVETPVDEIVKRHRALWAAASPSARAAILHDLAGRSLPKGYAISTPEADNG